jgi:hypothetical protein
MEHNGAAIGSELGQFPSPALLLSCTGLLPSILARQICQFPVRSEWNAMNFESGEAVGA